MASESGKVTVTHGPTTYEGNYVVAGGLVRLLSNIGNKDAHVGNRPPETIARILLGELVKAREAKIAGGP